MVDERRLNKISNLKFQFPNKFQFLNSNALGCLEMVILNLVLLNSLSKEVFAQ
jgi:hypothetical protein